MSNGFLTTSNTTYLSSWLNSSYVVDHFSNVYVDIMLLNPITNYFNPATLFDFFFFDLKISNSMSNIQSYLNDNTRSVILEMYKLASGNLHTLNYNTNLTLLNIKFSAEDFANSFVFNISTQIVSELNFLTKPKTNAEALIDILPEHTDTLEIFEVISINVDNSLYEHIHVPEFKLYYPEPFIASPSFVHDQLWFMHILHYQHWLWFFFISLIWLFFITFINTVRWANPRNKPKRETRGVSRSKCADLITACVPVSWAMSIIISESVDAADYYDGFGTGEIVVGIRAYQWGWEYFYPKNIDLSYNVNPTYSSITGNSLKYTKTTESVAATNQFWKAMRSKTNVNISSTPAHAILSPTDNNKILNFINFKSIGDNTINNANAFKKIQSASKTNINDLFNNTSDFVLKYNKFNNLYLSDLQPQETNMFGIKRQHEYGSIQTVSNNSASCLDSKSVSKLLAYNYDFLLNNTNRDNINLNNNTRSVVEVLPKSQFQDKKVSLTKQSQLGNILFNTSSTDINTNLIELNPIKSNLGKDISHMKFLWKQPVSKDALPKEEYSVRNINNFSPTKVNYNINPSEFNLKQLSTVYSFSSAPRTEYTNNLNLSFDKFTAKNTPAALLHSDKDISPELFFTTPWKTIWGNSNINLRLFNADKFDNSKKSLAVPSIIEYAGFDFLNWQALELIEDSFWESAFPGYTQDEYRNILSNVSELHKLRSNEKKFFRIYREWTDLDNLLYTPFFNDFINDDALIAVPFYTEDYCSNSTTTPLLSFGSYNNEVEVDSFDEAYSSNKFNNYIHHMNYFNNLGLYINNHNLPSHVQVLNAFRARVEETINTFDVENTSIYSNNLNSLENHETRSANYLKLRSTAKAKIKGFNAIQKVFKYWFDDGRANIRFNDFANMSVKVPFLSENRINYEKLLGKNKEVFFEPINYKPYLSKNYHNLHSTVNSLNVYFASIPFLLSYNSDPAKFLWFDWTSRWNSLEVQPSSISRYSLLGVPYFSKNFEYATDTTKDFRDTETYLLRLSKARKNYMSNWALTPYIYNRLSNWYSINSYIGNTLGTQDVDSLRLTLKLSSKYWTNSILDPTLHQATPSLNDHLTPNRSSNRPVFGLQGYSQTLSTLVNILTKREYLYREFFLQKGLTINLPTYLTAAPTNTLFEEIKHSYTFTDPSNFITEVGRDFFYENTNITRFNFLSNLINLNSHLNTIPFLNNLNYYLFNLDLSENINANNELYKNQYRPMRKGISNMIKLHATGAIAMPIEIRIHLLCSSKDIIHSWAIPSAGIKMDCVPGYSSHRVTIFLFSGIFWGQCMEICGRFHHWMPIIVYFMKKDMFFLWCTHFVHFSTNDLNFSTLDKEFSSKVKQVSFSGNWIN